MTLELVLQGLPCSEGFIKSRPALESMNCAALALARFPVSCTAWDGKLCAGETIFSKKKTPKYPY